MRDLMKNETVTLKKILVTMLLIVAMLLQSCETEIPETDTEQPVVTFHIKGDGIDRIFNDDDRSREIYLTSGATYKFTFTVGDPGGLSAMGFRFNPTLMEVLSVSPNTWSYQNSSTIASAGYFWTGDENNPLNGGVLTGTFMVNGDEDVFDLDMWGYDFGGESGDRNYGYKSFKITVGDLPPLIGPII